MKILLVEDDSALRAALEELLLREGYEVKKAANYREARAGLDGSMDLVMLDVGFLSHLPGAMSGGQQQRFSIARALANKPAILFADEPTGNLDGKAGREVLTLLRTVSRELGITLVLVTHDMTVAEQADRIIRLRDGQIEHDSGVV